MVPAWQGGLVRGRARRELEGRTLVQRSQAHVAGMRPGVWQAQAALLCSCRTGSPGSAAQVSWQRHQSRPATDSSSTSLKATKRRQRMRSSRLSSTCPGGEGRGGMGMARRPWGVAHSQGAPCSADARVGGQQQMEHAMGLVRSRATAHLPRHAGAQSKSQQESRGPGVDHLALQPHHPRKLAANRVVEGVAAAGWGGQRSGIEGRQRTTGRQRQAAAEPRHARQAHATGVALTG